MLKSAAVAIVVSLMLGAMPAIAKDSCDKICAARCQSSMAKSGCMDRCMPVCKQNHK